MTDHFVKHPGLVYNWLQYIPRESSDAFFGGLRTSIIQSLKLYPYVVSTDNVLRKPTEVIILGSRFKHGGNPLVPEKYLAGLRYLSSNHKIQRDGVVLGELGVRDMNFNDFWGALTKMNQDGILVRQDSEWWETTCNILFAKIPVNRSELYLSTLRVLPMVPLVEGPWVTPQEPNLYFNDRQQGGIPTDLGIRLVQTLSSSFQHYAVLSRLGIEEAKPASILKCIVNLHAEPRENQHVLTLPSHALYNHARDVTRSNIRVLTSSEDVMWAREVYLDHDTFVDPVLKDFIAVTGVAVLHADYYTQVDAASLPEFVTFLKSRLGINVAPRVVQSGLSSELRKFISAVDSGVLLRTLRKMWPLMGAKVGEDGLQELRAVVVMCADGSRRRLDTTFVRRPELQQLKDLSFLILNNPEDMSWDFLGQLGVSLQADATAYLKRLQQLASSDDRPDIQDVEDIYRQLELRAGMGQRALIQYV